jgi:hypothetical protein
MYRLLELKGILRGIDQRWQTIDVNSFTVKMLFERFRAIYAQVQYGDSTPEFIDVNQFLPIYSQYGKRFDELLIDLGSVSLVTCDKPNFEVKTCRYSDAFAVNYTAYPYSPIYGVTGAAELLDDLLLTRSQPPSDYESFVKNCMVSINGFWHYIGTDKINGVVVKDAMKSNRRCGQNQCGILSFFNVGEIEYVKIQDENIVKGSNPEPMALSTYIHFDRDLSDKQVIFVIGGYLILPDSASIRRVSPNTFAWDVQNYQLLDRLYEASQFLDFSELGLVSSPHNPSQFSMAQITSDAFLTKYLKLSQSFVVIVNAKHLYSCTHHLRNVGIPNQYLTQVDPKWPIVTGSGRMPEYWKTSEFGKYTLWCKDAYDQKRAYHSSNLKNLISYSDARDPQRATTLSRACFLEIGKDFN